MVVASIALIACDDRSSVQPQLGVAYFNWYGFDPETGDCLGDTGSTHWNSNGDLVRVKPVLGYYCSGDEDVIAQQVQWMQEVGVSWLLIGWWGWGDNDLDGDVDDPVRQAQHQATEQMYQHLSGLNGDVRAAISVDNFIDVVEGQILGEKESEVIWDRIQSDFVDRFPDAYFTWQGKPLVVSFAPLVLQPDDRFTYRRLWPKTFPEAEMHGFPMDWSLYALSDWDDPVRDVISEDGFGVLTARFDTCWSVQRPGCKSIDPYLTDGYYDANWRVAFEHWDELRLLLIYSWNEYHEQAQIEPSYGDRGTGFMMLAKTHFYWDRVNSGRRFSEYNPQSE